MAEIIISHPDIKVTRGNYSLDVDYFKECTDYFMDRIVEDFENFEKELIVHRVEFFGK